MYKYWCYFKYVVNHKWLVILEGRKLNLGLLRLLLHDWDKFLPASFAAYTRRYFSDGDYATQLAFSLEDVRYQMAWHMHAKRNKHHWQWWVTPKDDGSFHLLHMHDADYREMLADWYAMSRARNEKVLDWYTANRHKIHLHPDTRTLVEAHIGYIND